MTDTAAFRTIRVRSYRDRVHDASRSFRLPLGDDLRAALKRAALAAVPKREGWALHVLTVERTAAGEHVAAVLDQLARREMGGPDFVAALAATLDGSCAVLAVASRDAGRFERLRASLAKAGG